ncbi:LysM peptidoglycan-binding domain-containing protein [Aureimonas altamirensis]|uniref:LysM peptidoglycan-binding domain-containing protein n=1 Tax=Aureimonas altamirensis TaxID=370622 RepID=UPI0025577E15|nr:LysM peptidoglycan-binding domain-containing protein [Aureimonas altamirensis]
MKRKSGVLFATAAMVGVAGLVAGYLHFGNTRALPDGQVTLAKVSPEALAPLAGQAPSATPPAPDVPAQAAAPASSNIPSFDVVRVEPDGSAVLAGRAAPDTVVRIVAAGRVIATARTNAQGEFAVTLDVPLAVGEHQIHLETGEGEAVLASAESAIVSIPMPGRESELLVLLEQPDGPSRVIAAPAPQVAAAGAATADATAPAAPAAPAADPNAPAIGAVEIEGDQIYVAGTAAKGSKVRLYLNDAFVAEAPIGSKREFLASARQAVPVGTHVVRADVVDKAGSVVARAEVPFERPDREHVAAVAASPALPGMSAAEKADTTLASNGEPAGGLQEVDGRVIIRKGDTLWRISRENYGVGSRYTVIYLANGDQIRNPDLIYPGQVFRMPAHEAAQATGG